MPSFRCSQPRHTHYALTSRLLNRHSVLEEELTTGTRRIETSYRVASDRFTVTRIGPIRDSADHAEVYHVMLSRLGKP